MLLYLELCIKSKFYIKLVKNININIYQKINLQQKRNIQRNVIKLINKILYFKTNGLKICLIKYKVNNKFDIYLYLN